MKTLPYDERIEWLENHFAQLILDNNWKVCNDTSVNYILKLTKD